MLNLFSRCVQANSPLATLPGLRSLQAVLSGRLHSGRIMMVYSETSKCLDWLLVPNGTSPDLSFIRRTIGRASAT
jgi:hypothetical protein